MIKYRAILVINKLIMLFLKLKEKVLSNKIAIKHQHGRGSCFDKIWHGSDMLHKFYCLQEVNVLLIFFVNLMTNFRT